MNPVGEYKINRLVVSLNLNYISTDTVPPWTQTPLYVYAKDLFSKNWELIATQESVKEEYYNSFKWYIIGDYKVMASSLEYSIGYRGKGRKVVSYA